MLYKYCNLYKGRKLNWRFGGSLKFGGGSFPLWIEPWKGRGSLKVLGKLFVGPPGGGSFPLWIEPCYCICQLLCSLTTSLPFMSMLLSKNLMGFTFVKCLMSLRPTYRKSQSG